MQQHRGSNQGSCDESDNTGRSHGKPACQGVSASDDALHCSGPPAARLPPVPWLALPGPHPPRGGRILDARGAADRRGVLRQKAYSSWDACSHSDRSRARTQAFSTTSPEYIRSSAGGQPIGVSPSHKDHQCTPFLMGGHLTRDLREAYPMGHLQQSAGCR